MTRVIRVFRDQPRSGRKGLTMHGLTLVVLLTLSGCGGSGDSGETGRQRFEKARSWYERDFSNATSPPTPAPTAFTAAATPAPGDATTVARPAISGVPATGTASAPAAGAGATTPVTAVGTRTSLPTLASLTAERTPPVNPPAALLALAQTAGTGKAASAGANALPGTPGSLATQPNTNTTAGSTGTAPIPEGTEAVPGLATATPGPGSGTPAPQGEQVPTPSAPQPTPTVTPTPTPSEPADSDSKPPVISGIEFDPSTAPENSRVNMTVMASDDRAGAESAKGTVIGPSGQKAYFNLVAEPTGTMLTGGFKIPPAAESGPWTIQEIVLTDKAKNSGSYTPANDAIVRAARLMVEGSGGDTEPPTLVSISISPAETRDASQVKVFVSGKDSKSNLHTVRGTLTSPSGAVSVPWSSYVNKATGLFEGPINIPPHAEMGVWKIGQLVLIDSAKNRLTIDAPDGRIDGATVKVTSKEDKDAPELRSIAFSPASVRPPAVTALDIVAQDDVSGVKSASGLIQMGASTSPLAFSAQRFAPGQFRAQIDVPNPAPLGTWKVMNLLLVDYAGNQANLPSTDPMVATAILEVQ